MLLEQYLQGPDHESFNSRAHGFNARISMSFLLDATLLHGTGTQHAGVNGQAVAPSLKRRHSISNQGLLSPLVRLLRNPVDIVGNVVEGLRDGLSPEERAERLKFENRRQILYLRLRNASLPDSHSVEDSFADR